MLLVLALLVSTLLVGRQIIDRAKVQQVISEIDYYTKNFQMFRDQYDFLPGALGIENCKKYPEFSLQKGDSPDLYPSQCDDLRSRQVMMSESNYYTTYKQANFSMVDMVASGMVENKSPGERRRKAFDIATTTVEKTVNIPVVRGGGYATLRDSFLVSYVDWGGTTIANGASNCFYKIGSNGIINQITTLIGSKRDDGSGNHNNKTVSSFISSVLNTCPQSNANSSETCVSRKCDCYCTKVDGTIYNANYYSAYVYQTDVTTVKLTSTGKAALNGKMEQITGTIITEGEFRIALLLNKDEIENQANKSSFDSKTWVSYSSGKVDQAMIYGIGNENLFSPAGENNVIVFFHFDPDKTETTDDGAVSFNLFDLMNKKLGSISQSNDDGNKNSSGNSLIPINRTSGEGFNFAYVMR